MTPRRLIDTNFLVRHLVQDHERHAKIASKLFHACDQGDVILVVLPAVLAECVFVLESFYKHPHSDIAIVLTKLLSSPGVELENSRVHLAALNRYAESKLHFVDCTIAAFAVERRCPVATFDAGFKKWADIQIVID